MPDNEFVSGIKSNDTLSRLAVFNALMSPSNVPPSRPTTVKDSK
jgi:hypothetical protein